MIKYLAGCLASVLVAYILAVKVDVSGSMSMLLGLDPGFLVYCALLYAGVYLFRALRLAVLLKDAGIPFPDLLSVVAVHNFLNMLMPLRSGEFSFFLLLKKVSGVDYRTGAASLLLVRIYDLVTFICLVAVFMLSELFTRNGLPWALALFYPAAAAFYLLFFRKVEDVLSIALSALNRAAKVLGGRRAFVAKAASFMREFESEVGRVASVSDTPKLAFFSLSVWLLYFGMFYVFVSRLDTGISFFQAGVGSSGAVITTMLPVNSPGSVGTLEGGWTLGYVLAGVDRGAALASGVLMHVFILIFGMILAAAAGLRLGGVGARRVAS